MAFASVPRQLGPLLVRNVLCTTQAGAMLGVEEPGGGGRQTVMLLDPDLRRWPSRLRDRQGLPAHPRVCSLRAEAPVRVRHGSRTLYYVGAEALSGWTVLDEIAREGAIRPLHRAARLCAEAADALAWTHEAGLHHGHLEPGCLFIQTFDEEDPGHVKLLGLGLQVVAGPASRAARYRPPSFYRQGAPRSIRGGSAAAREDGFALAAVLYHMITGQAPDFADLGAALSPLAEAHPGLAELLLRALAPSPRARFASAQALRAALVGLDLTERRPEPVLLNCPRTWRRRLPMA